MVSRPGCLGAADGLIAVTLTAGAVSVFFNSACQVLLPEVVDEAIANVIAGSFAQAYVPPGILGRSC